MTERTSNVVAMPARPPRLRADVPPFDPTNEAHLRAWEALWDMGQRDLAKLEGHGARG